MASVGTILEGKVGPVWSTNFQPGNSFRGIGYYYDPNDAKEKISDDGLAVALKKTTTSFTIKTFASVTAGNEAPATPTTEIILDATDFKVNNGGSTLFQATTAGGGPGAPYGDGSSSAPAIAFTDETKTGFYRIGSGNVGISINEIKRADFATNKFSYSSDNNGTTDFGQLVLRGLTDTNKYLSFCLNTTDNFAFVQAGIEGTGYSDLAIGRNGSSSLLIGATSNTYSSKVFVNGSVGTSNSVTVKDGSLASPSLRFGSALDTGILYNSGIGDESGIDFSVGESKQFTINNNALTMSSLKLKSSNTNGVELKTPGSLSASYSLTFPSEAAPEGTVLAVGTTGICSWINPFFGLFGAGIDGDVTLGSNITLTRDMYYNNLTINSDFTIETNSFRIYIKGTLTIGATTLVDGIIKAVGTNGTNASSATGAAAPAVLSPGSFQTMGRGGAGATSVTGAGVQGSANTTGLNPISASTGGTSGGGGSGAGGAASADRSGGVPTRTERSFLTHSVYRASAQMSSGNAGPGGGSGAGSGAATGGGGGSGGNPGGNVHVFANIININPSAVAPIFASTGGNGGNGFSTANANSGGGGGGGGGGSGGIMVVCNKVIGPPPANWIRLRGGAGGNGGNGNGTGNGGKGGGGGAALGNILYICISRNVISYTFNSGQAVTPTVANSGTTGGTGNSGATFSISTY